MKRFNIYYIFDILLTSSAIFLLLTRKDVRYLYVVGSLIIATVILVWLEINDKTQLTQTVITNNSDETVAFKPENDSQPQKLVPHTTVEGADGFKISGKVFKACSGTHVVIDENCRIRTKSLTGKIANTIRGGVLTTPPDESWNQLFEA